ncbi:MAG TPA: hypothetical protein VFQ13_12545 [Anaerolineales bacterium]|nr:hypothetical protein [Anaerolineales bacterium]
MNPLQLRFVSAGLFFLLILPSGFWLSHSGKPYGTLLFTAHKLIGLGLFVFLAINVYQVNQATPLSALELTACLVAALFFLATIVTGGLVSVDKAMPVLVSLAHKLFPYLTVLSTVASLYLLLRQR